MQVYVQGKGEETRPSVGRNRHGGLVPMTGAGEVYAYMNGEVWVYTDAPKSFYGTPQKQANTGRRLRLRR